MLAPGVLVVSEPRRVALTAAEIVANLLRARPGVRLLLPTGEVARGMYAALRAHVLDGSLPLEGVTAFQFDEYVGLGGGDPRSVRATLDRELVGLRFGTRHALDGTAPDPEAEAARYQALLDERPIDIAVLGLGFSGPGATADQGVHRVTLDPAGAPREALTVGLRTLRAAREVLVLASGEDNAEALHAMLEGAVGPAVPASLLRDHPAVTVICDAAAAARLSPAAERTSDRVVVVLGHREPMVSPEHRISAHSRARMFRAEEACLTDPVRAAVLTGYTQTGGLSEAEQMQREWTVPGVPAVTEVAGRNTAENASRSLPLIVAIGGIREVLVVSSLWHLRAPFFFAPYASYGLRTRWRPARPLRHWGHLLVEELAKLPAAPLERAAAMRDVRLP
ncbi:MAG TPA: 6-phosphogluconolactonase [Solirubrobacteraceae bacterium]